ncbi:MAG: SAM-dependent methyltransferase, partial [Bifidobacterium crudilactis]|nr:SAM-dependent methyltransferase [Bifidobacterium crudilactis]
MQTESAQSTQQFVQNDASSRAGEASSGAGNHGESVAAQSSSSQSSSGLASSGLASLGSASAVAVTSASVEFGHEAALATPSVSQALVPQGTVVLAATPIGNVHDASARLVALLQEADIVAAEDTRRLYDLANRLGVHVGGRVIAYHDHNEREKSDGLLDQVERGACVLVVSDAGMPTINDPGLAIVRRAIERGIPVTCAPGPSAVLDALALSGLPTDR